MLKQYWELAGKLQKESQEMLEEYTLANVEVAKSGVRFTSKPTLISEDENFCCVSIKDNDTNLYFVQRKNKITAHIAMNEALAMRK